MDPEQNGLNGAHSAADKTTETASAETLANHDSTTGTTAAEDQVASTQETNGEDVSGSSSKRQGDDLESPPAKREKIPSLKLRLSLSSKDSTPPTKKKTTKKDTPKKDTPKKDSTKKDSTKKDTPKKDSKKAATPKKATPKKATPKKETTTTKKETPKKDTPKKTAASKAKAAAAAEETAVKSEPGTAESTPAPSTPTKTANGKKAVPCPPKFQILLSDYPEYVIWGRLQIREFLIRFNDIISIGSRHGPSLNDLTGPWNEFMYKHIITALLSVLTKDYAVHAKLPPNSNNAYNHPGPPMDKEVHRDLVKQIERIPAESERLWLMLSDYIEIANERLGDIDPVVGKTVLKDDVKEEEEEETKQTSREVQKLGELSTELDYEKRSIDLVGRLITLVASTEQVRNALARDNDQRETSYTETVKNLNVQWYKKREELKQSRPNGAGKGRAALYEWQDVHAVAKNAWIESVEQAKYAVIMGNRHRRHRMQPVGKDHLGNTYWVCQERLTGVRDLSSFIIVEKAEDSEYPVPMQELVAYNEAYPPQPKKKPVKKAAQPAKEEGEEGDETPAAEEVVEEEVEEEEEAPPLLPDPIHQFYHFSLNTSRPLLGANQNTSLYMVTCKEDGELLAKWLPYHMGEKDPTKPPNERDKFIQRIKQVSEIMLPRELIAT